MRDVGVGRGDPLSDASSCKPNFIQYLKMSSENKYFVMAELIAFSLLVTSCLEQSGQTFYYYNTGPTTITNPPIHDKTLLDFLQILRNLLSRLQRTRRSSLANQQHLAVLIDDDDTPCRSPLFILHPNGLDQRPLGVTQEGIRQAVLVLEARVCLERIITQSVDGEPAFLEAVVRVAEETRLLRTCIG